ncbi:MAG TPA: BPSS1780 family membrane protein [Burkholderiales bacterium]|nr:BPSS1780 family membrane protein [Burkholderiales bacterium]
MKGASTLERAQVSHPGKSENMEVRVVAANRGWHWLVEGFALFRRSPAMWIAIVVLLYVVFALLVRIPVFGIVVLLFFPALLAGLMHGCTRLEAGDPLEIGHLVTGFRRNAAYLVTLGGISLVGNLLLLMLFVALSGEATMAIMKNAAAGKVDPAAAEAVMRAAPRVLTAALVVMTLSLPLLMGLWFAPLLVYFHDLKPLRALFVSLWACWKNALPFLVYGIAVFLGLMVLTPFTIALRQTDLSLWLLAPVLIPSVYASYKDVFGAPPPVTAVAGALPR